MKVKLDTEIKNAADNEYENFKYSVDWLNGYLPFSDVNSLFEDLKKIDSRFAFENWNLWHKGMHFYSNRFVWNGKPTFNIAFNAPISTEDIPVDIEYHQVYVGDDLAYELPLYADDKCRNNGIFISISGDGIREINSVDGTLDKLFKYLYEQKFSCSRIDFACDIFEKKNPIVPILSEAFMYAVCKEEKMRTITSMTRRNTNTVKINLYQDKYRDWNNFSYNFTFGNHGSSYGMFRMYDKWLEVKTGRLSNISDEMLKVCPSDYWYRLEIEVHKDKARPLFNELMSGKINCCQAWAFGIDKMFSVKIARTSNSSIHNCVWDDDWKNFIEFCKNHHTFIQEI